MALRLSLHDTGRLVSLVSFWDSVDHGGHRIVFEVVNMRVAGTRMLTIRLKVETMITRLFEAQSKLKCTKFGAGRAKWKNYNEGKELLSVQTVRG